MTTSPLQPGWCEALYQAHAARLLLYGRALGLAHSEAEDVLHEVFRELLSLEHPPAHPPGYALRSMRNRARNFRRGL
ncbi:MAG: RNA polymerase sigma factor, partial [Verrucomicrobiota bacterium]